MPVGRHLIFHTSVNNYIAAGSFRTGTDTRAPLPVNETRAQPVCFMR